MRRKNREERSPTLPSKLDSPGNDLAGLLTYTSVELERLPGSAASSGWIVPAQFSVLTVTG
jgi:hypothetical protein